MVLNSQLPNQPQRVQNWYQEFISTLKESKTDKESGQIQLRLPKDNPLLGLVEIANGLARRIPIILEIQNPNLVYSVALASSARIMRSSWPRGTSRRSSSSSRAPTAGPPGCSSAARPKRSSSRVTQGHADALASLRCTTQDFMQCWPRYWVRSP